jgi:hypothetical protein
VLGDEDEQADELQANAGPDPQADAEPLPADTGPKAFTSAP